MNIYVGNLSHSSTEDGLRQLFEQFGAVASVKLMTDKFTGQPRGFAFVEMPVADEARQAIENTNGVDLDGRNLRVNEARPVEARGDRNPRGSRPFRPGGFGGPRGGGDRNRRF
jgi:RNA recognition motif-containing protein